ncbi:helicase [Taibaiella sp. KBW10]|uniref:helix-turn-helix domain-containing protein n=1 Tax=Taibaiella sp. KBW10 TaxID=2153357 RepID=UPI000F5B8625|nr:helix-turn-helix domain-containing protein [Taibaiella sp. KBW10]RQO32265.1 helicase [Taibaiella sp. KBW10]
MMEVNSIFEKAVSFVNQTNQPIFLTGKAGTGKTTFLRHIKSHSHKRMAVIAPTGVAAINAGGTTIHSFFNLPFGTYIPTTKTVWGGAYANVYNKHQLFAKAKLNSIKRDVIKGLDTLIIDEISMVRADTLDAIDALLRMVRYKPNTPFGGVQMIFIGDMFQLPPVVKDEDWEQLKEVYNSPFFFDAQVMQEAEPVYIELKKIYRQRDDMFIKILNNVRNNTCNEEDLEILNEHYDPYFIPDAHSEYITLTTHNYKADEINQNALEQLMSEPVVFEAKISGEFPPNAYPVEEQLVLKTGAQIMFIKNDKGESRRYYNGKIGTIEAINPIEKQITVRFASEPDPLVLEAETWKNIKYDFDKDNDEIKELELGTYTQYPVRLAWAVTIHKSQGLTFEKAIVDAGQSFAAGQVYVALSRLTKLDGLVLKSKITPASINTDPRIIDFAKNESSEQALENQLLMSQQIFAEQAIAQAFDFAEVYDLWLDFTKDMLKRSIPEKEAASAFAVQSLEQIKAMEQTGKKFEPLILSILNQSDPEKYNTLNERVQAGSSWYLNILTQVNTEIQNHIETYRIKQKTKKYIGEVKEQLQGLERKKIQIEQAAAVAMGLSARIDMHMVMQEVNKMFAPVPIVLSEAEDKQADKEPKPEKGQSKIISLELFGQGMSIEKIAETRNMSVNTIFAHLADAVAAGSLDASKLIPEKKLNIVMEIIAAHPYKTLTELKELLGADFSFNDLKVGKAKEAFNIQKQ